MVDIINVKDYGAVGNGITDDYAAVQAAFDAAFGTAGSPHGSANATLNKPVFFPNGSYLFVSGTPTLTRVVGGYIYGAGAGATILTKATGSVIAFNGAANLIFERFNVIGGGTNSPLINLDWDNTSGGDGLHSNTFREILFSNFVKGLVIANSGFGGADNLFEQCTFSGSSSTTGIEAKSTTALNNTVIAGGASGCAQGYYSSGGSIHVYEQSCAGNTVDVRVDSGFPVCVIGGRTESGVSSGQTLVSLSSGQVTVRGVQQQGSAGKIANITGGKITLDSASSACVITGNAGSLYLRGNYFTSGTLLTGYSGTVVQNI